MAIFRSNHLLQTFALPTLLSLLSYLLYTIYNILNDLTRSRFFRSITLKNQDPNYDVVVSYITRRCTLRASSHVAETYKRKNKTWKDRMREWSTGVDSDRPRFVLKPSSSKGGSVSFINYKGSRVVMSRKVGETVCVGWDRKPVAMEELTLTVWGRDSRVLTRLLGDALEDGREEAKSTVNIWVLSSDGWGSMWEKALTKRPRPMASVILKGDTGEMLIDDARSFQAGAQWYFDRGIPYRRGYCLHGPPGTGKTSFVQAMAGTLGKDICMLNLSDKELTDTRLASALREAPGNALVMIEDIDSVFVERRKRTEGGGDRGGGVTFSGLLNALDGVASQEGRITVMTTNHLERLDPALVRPGRVDLKVELSNATKDQAGELFARFFPSDGSGKVRFKERVKDGQVSMAAVQCHLLKYRDSPSAAVERVGEMLGIGGGG
ncbi:hypothetical protein TrRE_jg10297, partial [Triparma retinervis]